MLFHRVSSVLLSMVALISFYFKESDWLAQKGRKFYGDQFFYSISAQLHYSLRKFFFVRFEKKNKAPENSSKIPHKSSKNLSGTPKTPFLLSNIFKIEKLSTFLPKDIEILKSHGTRQKGLHNQLPSEVINALACFHCLYCWQNQTALNPNKKKKLQCSFVNCFSVRKAVKSYSKSKKRLSV